MNNQLISVNFNLRNQKSKTPTPIYLIVYLKGVDGKKKQRKITTNQKILPVLWDNKKQQPTLYNNVIQLTEEQQVEQVNLFNNLLRLKLEYLRKYGYIPNNQSNLKLINKRNMTNNIERINGAKRLQTEIKLLKDGLNEYAKERKLAASTKRRMGFVVSHFIGWVDKKNKRDSVKLLLQPSFNEFMEFQKKNTSAINANYDGRNLSTLIKYIAGTVKGGKYGIKEVTYTRLKEEKGQIKCEILDKEIEQFKKVEVVNKTEQFYKDVFLLMLATGQRISDTCSLIKGQYTVAKDGVIVLPTQKCDTTAYIQPTHDVVEALESIKKYKNIKEKSVTVNINGMIKRLFERAGLNRVTPNKLELYKEVTSHMAKHSLIYK